VTTNNGNLSVTGSGGAAATGRTNYGIHVEYVSSVVQATGTGTVTLTGTGGGGTTENIGIMIYGSTVQTAGGRSESHRHRRRGHRQLRRGHRQSRSGESDRQRPRYGR